MSSESVHRAAGDVALAEQFDNHDGDRPPASAALVGERLRLTGEHGATTLLHFASDREVVLEPAGPGPWAPAAAAYEALPLRDGWTAVAMRIDDRHSTFLVLDTPGRRALAVVSALDGGDGRPVTERTEYVQAGIDGELRRPFARSDALVGRRIEWRYSDTHVFEHIYLNPTAYCWHCVAGPERWIGDVDPCVVFELADELFLFAWSETVVPFNGAAVLDLRAWRSTGRFFGWDTDRHRAQQIVVGARGRLVNVTTHEEIR